jgi:hypothetical protein
MLDSNSSCSWSILAVPFSFSMTPCKVSFTFLRPCRIVWIPINDFGACSVAV